MPRDSRDDYRDNSQQYSRGWPVDDLTAERRRADDDELRREDAADRARAAATTTEGGETPVL